ncbi:MAG: (2Fe-2S)-binding protein [Bradymonadales bacterium]|nr:(2Fe-2S)-binding protein [Bradymonadales bacterium]
MPTCTIDGQTVTAPEGTTILGAAESIGIAIPYFCFHPALQAPANCRMCLVEIEGMPKLEPSCRTPIREGMVVHTSSQRVLEARRGVLEFILINHPIDCPICDQAGECWLQDHYLQHDFAPSRLKTGKVSKIKVHSIGPEVIYDGERCILCTRCVRFCDEITRTGELTVVQRGDTSEIRTFPGRKLDNPYSMCTADLCPVGALTTRHFRFRRRVWFLKTTPSICTGCARCCAVHLDHYRQHAERYLPRYHRQVNQYWMCDAGRYTVEEIHANRLLDIELEGQRFEHWAQAVGPIARRLAHAVDGGVQPARWAMVLSPQSSTEGLLAAVEFARSCLGEARLYRGGKPLGTGDDFLIHADRNPNNAGLDRAAGDQPVGEIEQLADRMEAGEIDALYLMGSHLPADNELLLGRLQRALAMLKLLVVQSIWNTPFAERAHILLPVASHAEQTGTYINCDGIVQTVGAAFPPQGNSLPDWEIFWKLSGALDRPLPFASPKEALDRLGLAATGEQPPDPEAGRIRAPHGPKRPIPRRGATPVAGKRA